MDKLKQIQMEDMWSHQENIEELKLMYSSLEAVKMEAYEEMRKNEETVNYLLNLLKLAYQERDEAKSQLQNLVNKLLPSSSSITESNGSSPIGSFFENGSSPEICTINQQTFCKDQDHDHDQAYLLLNNIVAGEKALPEKGKFLKAVMAAGPLLQTLLIAGPLPSWRNPPPPPPPPHLQHFKIPRLQ